MDMNNKFPYVVTFESENNNRINWCFEHLGPSIFEDPTIGRWFVHYCKYIEYYFKNEEDATLFKLTWM